MKQIITELNWGIETFTTVVGDFIAIIQSN